MARPFDISELSRRQWLIGAAAAVAGAGGLGAIWIGAANPRDLVFKLLQRALPGVDLDPESVGLCAQEVAKLVDAQYPEGTMLHLRSHWKLKAATAASGVLGANALAELGPVEERMHEIARAAVTQLLPNSNFFRVPDPTAERIYYVSPDPNAPCVNPFADLSPPSGPQPWPVE